MTTKYELKRVKGRNVLYVPSVDQYIFIRSKSKRGKFVQFDVAFDAELEWTGPLDWECWTDDGVIEAGAFFKALASLCVAESKPQRRKKV